ncbi:hypothetical protein [Tritonibacter scottomollicae]|uniref:Uncharacterized protein n=1 Tax=Tritonibacter scottomollicae TaxID=483013 RepID=A0A2T1AK88_TRISK|nr:hypothetical protein [Tritonibacter scottomollicae]PRZ49025.1 hypothetical protein CLV89_103340 [Tritonibacter scottomollicae]
MALDDQTFIWAVKSLSGEISTQMRMVVLKMDGRKATFRYYLDQEPSDFTRERAEVVAVNFDSGMSFALGSLEIEFKHSTEPLGKLDVLDGILFRRWENSACRTDADQ